MEWSPTSAIGCRPSIVHSSRWTTPDGPARSLHSVDSTRCPGSQRAGGATNGNRRTRRETASARSPEGIVEKRQHPARAGVPSRFSPSLTRFTTRAPHPLTGSASPLDRGPWPSSFPLDLGPGQGETRRPLTVQELIRLGRSTDASGSRFDTSQPTNGRATGRTGFPWARPPVRAVRRAEVMSVPGFSPTSRWRPSRCGRPAHGGPARGWARTPRDGSWSTHSMCSIQSSGRSGQPASKATHRVGSIRTSATPWCPPDGVRPRHRMSPTDPCNPGGRHSGHGPPMQWTPLDPRGQGGRRRQPEVSVEGEAERVTLTETAPANVF